MCAQVGTSEGKRSVWYSAPTCPPQAAATKVHRHLLGAKQDAKNAGSEKSTEFYPPGVDGLGRST